MLVLRRRLLSLQRSTRVFSSASESLSLSLSLSRLSHQSRVQFQAGDAARTEVEIVPVLSADDFALRVTTASDSSIDVQSLFDLQEEAVEGAVGGAESVKALRISKKSVVDAKLQLLLPHTVDLNLAVANGSVTLKDKIEGDIKVVLGRGDIEVNKVRGTNVSLKTNGGKIDVLALVEGERVRLEANEGVKCKRLMAGKAEVKLGKGEASDSEFGAIYASTCNVASTNQSGRSTLRVGNIHGYLRVSSEGLNSVEVDSVTGALEVEDSGDKCNVVAHFDSWTNDASSSILVGGDVRVSLQPAAAIDVELHGTKVTVGKDCEFVSSEMDQLDEDYAVFTGELRAQDGAIAAVSSSSGKINMDSAKDDAMRTSFFMKENATDDEEARTPRLFVHALSGEVALDQLNWMDNIKRKHLKR
ncbi:hypothetical protein PPTG_10532 [Phytophthora nicotianae INRA-310]|uniref:Adhesin domain-containing protein n=2 Tax=Phytophthora nicotianae TaxID=4792 RepID=W2QC14_PHYN3|nr:hypothetical protein PPTG_10532 [Phytophthora nicotianae INRA-310]ETN10396.1 hypothetical protein PPTG_10532 [Phytophthora nicotianae INRA-310]KUF96318.1 hypothetical protein AM588_10009459 [Phytophthora nicotianae]KUG00813.1 hypothetical protein AM587_10008649 [Phytophthora nicotianae]